MSSFWDGFDQNAFSAKLRTKLEKELSEGFSSLKEHLQPREKVKQGLDALERKAISSLKVQLDILKDLCRDLVFQEPAEAPRRLPVGFAGTDEDLDKEIDKSILKLNMLRAELNSVEVRLSTCETTTTVVETNLKRVRPVIDILDVKGISDITRDSKRLRYLMQCSKELRQKLPSAEDTSASIETLIAKERSGMASTRELQALDKLLSKSS